MLRNIVVGIFTLTELSKPLTEKLKFAVFIVFVVSN